LIIVFIYTLTHYSFLIGLYIAAATQKTLSIEDDEEEEEEEYDPKTKKPTTRENKRKVTKK
jgi:hypothetical protein